LANTTKYSSKKIFEKRPLCKLTSQANWTLMFADCHINNLKYSGGVIFFDACLYQ
jgi:hypothetical protein